MSDPALCPIYSLVGQGLWPGHPSPSSCPSAHLFHVPVEGGRGGGMTRLDLVGHLMLASVSSTGSSVPSVRTLASTS